MDPEKVNVRSHRRHSRVTKRTDEKVHPYSGSEGDRQSPENQGPDKSLFEKEQRKRKAKARLALAIAAFLGGCVKTVYLPSDAAYYQKQWMECQNSHVECEKELDECKELLIDSQLDSR